MCPLILVKNVSRITVQIIKIIANSTLKGSLRHQLEVDKIKNQGAHSIGKHVEQAAEFGGLLEHARKESVEVI